MLILGIHHVPRLTHERYEEVVRRLTNGKSRFESMADTGIEGPLVHVTGLGEDGFWVVDVWQSQEALDRFSQVVGPIHARRRHPGAHGELSGPHLRFRLTRPHLAVQMMGQVEDRAIHG